MSDPITSSPTGAAMSLSLVNDKRTKVEITTTGTQEAEQPNHIKVTLTAPDYLTQDEVTQRINQAKDENGHFIAERLGLGDLSQEQQKQILDDLGNHDLRNADFSGAQPMFEATFVNFDRVDLNGASFHGLNGTIIFHNVNLDSAVFAGMSGKLTFINSDVSKADFSDTHLEINAMSIEEAKHLEVTDESVTATNTEYSEVSYTAVQRSEYTSVNSTFLQRYASTTSLTHIEQSSTNFVNVQFREAIVGRSSNNGEISYIKGYVATFNSASFHNAEITTLNAHNVDFSNANFSGAKIGELSGSGNNFSNVDFSHSSMSWFSATSSNFTYSNFANVDISWFIGEKNDFKSADFSNSKIEQFMTSGSHFEQVNFSASKITSFKSSENHFSTGPIDAAYLNSPEVLSQGDYFNGVPVEEAYQAMRNRANNPNEITLNLRALKQDFSGVMRHGLSNMNEDLKHVVPELVR